MYQINQLKNWLSTVENTEAAAAAPNSGKNIIIKNCAPFIDCIGEINNTPIDNARDIG